MAYNDKNETDSKCEAWCQNNVKILIKLLFIINYY